MPIWPFPSAWSLLIFGTALMFELPVWEVVRSKDGDFAFSMPVQPTLKTQDVQGSAGTLEILIYSCQANGSRYVVQRTTAPQSVAPSQVIAELANLRKRYIKENVRVVKETKIVVDGVIGDDFTSIAPSPLGDGDVTTRIRHHLTGHSYYVMTVTSPPHRPLPDDASRFLSSLTFEALVKAHYARMKEGQKPAAQSRARAPRNAVQPRESTRSAVAVATKDAQGPTTKVRLGDSSPEDALKTFLLALAAQDEATLRAVTLPDDEFDWLLMGVAATPDFLARMEARLAEEPMKRLKSGDTVKMPDGEVRVIKPVDVGEGRVVLWPDGAPLPSRIENVGGHWKVFAKPFIAARKTAKVNRKLTRPKAVVKPRNSSR